jgi:predicted phosphodiesterase
MTVLLQISDTHFGTEQAPVVEALTALAHQQRPDVVVLSGDITQRARPAQFRAARAFTDRLGAPVLAVPGNHDIPLFDLWTRLRSPYARYSAAFGTTSSRCTALGNCWWCASTPRDPGATRMVRSPRADRPCGPATCGACRPCAAARGRGAPAHGRHACRGRAHPLRGHAAALQRWAEAGADLVMGGHIHLPLRHAAARPGASAVGRAGGHGRVVASARWRAQFGEPAALGRGFAAGLLPMPMGT